MIMGARRNFKLTYDNNQSIYFYSHWMASEMEDILRKALDRGRDRWDDDDGNKSEIY